MKIVLLKILRENVEELLSIISSVKRFFIEVAVSLDSYLTSVEFESGLFLEVSDFVFLR